MLNIHDVLTRGVEEVLPTRKALGDLMEKKKITLYQGFDPSMPSLHLGNYVGLLKLSQFQKLGHKVIFLVGDFTGMIGDPSGKSTARLPMTRQQVMDNAKSYKEQASRILSFDGDNPAQIKYNSEWLDKLSSEDFFRLASNLTYQQIIERDMFQKRQRDGKDIYLNEFLYPFMQGYDSVAMKVDLEVGGYDQLFNMLMGRKLMRNILKREKFVLATKLLVDEKGDKVGKTTGNALFLDSTPEEFFGGIMTFPDQVLTLAFELLTEVDLEGIEEKVKKDPMGEKKRLAFEVVKIIWGESTSKVASLHFEKTFQQKSPDFERQITNKSNLIETISQVTSSKSEAKRLISQGAVDVNGKVVDNPVLLLKSEDKIKIGSKIFVKVI